jgi:hypothetical protein
LSSSSSVVLGDDAMREKLDDDDDDDVYKELVYISNQSVAFALRFVFLCRRLNFFFLISFSATKLM